MMRRVALIFFLVFGACAKEVNQGDCSAVCAQLAEMLQADRVVQGQAPSEGLKPDNAEGLHNMDRCVSDCVNHSNEEQLDCLRAAATLDAWQACQ